MKRIIPLFLLSIACLASANIRDVKKLHQVFANIPARLGGYIDAEFFWDTRQVVGTDEDEFLLYPEPKLLDCNGQDINAKGQYASVAIQTRARLEFEGPDIRQASSMGVLEADFFGRQGTSNIFRLRHAFLQLKWEKIQLIAGQTWDPLYVLGVDPRTVSFNAGSPIETFGRSPQIRATFTPSELVKFHITALSEIDSPSDGPIGPSTTYLRNSVIPRMNARLDIYPGKSHVGASIEFKRIQPRLETNNCYKTRERLNSVTAEIYARYSREKWDTRTKLIFYQNATDLCILGGYAVSCIDECTDRREYTNLNGIGFWNDTQFQVSKSVIPGWFIGFAKNLGAREPICCDEVDADCTVTEKRIYGFGTDIDTLFRISPRILWKVENFTLGIELEYTRAAFGTIDCDGDVVDTCPVGNTRLLASLFYYF